MAYEERIITYITPKPKDELEFKGLISGWRRNDFTVEISPEGFAPAFVIRTLKIRDGHHCHFAIPDTYSGLCISQQNGLHRREYQQAKLQRENDLKNYDSELKMGFKNRLPQDTTFGNLMLLCDLCWQNNQENKLTIEQYWEQLQTEWQTGLKIR